MITYKEITKKNFYEIVKLTKTLTKEQQKCVAPNSYSIAEGSVHSSAYYRGIYLDETPIGFFMLYIPDEEELKNDSESSFYLWRFMIAYDYQKKHFGSKVIDHVVRIGRKHGFKELLTSCQMGKVSPYEFYIKYGFIDTGKVDDGEQVLKLEFN